MKIPLYLCPSIYHNSIFGFQGNFTSLQNLDDSPVKDCLNGNLTRGKYIILERANASVLSHLAFNISTKLTLGTGCSKPDYLKLTLKGSAITLSPFSELFWYNRILRGYLREFYIASSLVENYSR